MKRNAVLVFVVIASLSGACKKDNSSETETAAPTGSITLSFDHSVRKEPLVFGNVYTNDLNEDFTVSRFKYYVHDIKLVNHKNEVIELSKDYFLVDHESTDSRNIKRTVPVDTFTNIIYTLGVDSVRNVSGAQTGALDPALGMFWTWSSGYVMAKLEGHSLVSTISGQAFTLHVGGFRVPYITIRQIKLPLQENMIVAKDTSITVKVNADINTWFSRVHPISIAANPACHSPGKLANDIADNYEGMFSIKGTY
jgi:hypothetical protein